MDAGFSGDGSGLKNAWDEICVQVQYDESTSWDTYVDLMEGMAEGEIEELPAHQREAMWLQTSEGEDWEDEPVEDRDAYPVWNRDIAKHLLENYLYVQAGAWKNIRIRTFIDRYYCD